MSEKPEQKKMAGFPGTQPAFSITVAIAVPHLVGSASRSIPLTVMPHQQWGTGAVASEPGFKPNLRPDSKESE
jgi:hypothetical protein